MGEYTSFHFGIGESGSDLGNWSGTSTKPEAFHATSGSRERVLVAEPAPAVASCLVLVGTTPPTIPSALLRPFCVTEASVRSLSHLVRGRGRGRVGTTVGVWG